QSAINYTGGKFKLLPQLLPLFPKNINNFYDVFVGGANLAINVEANQYFVNDINEKVIDLYRYLSEADFNELSKRIEKIIDKYGLSNTQKNGYDFYNTNSSIGLKEVNKIAYQKLREDFNNGYFRKDLNPIIFYILIVYGFNNQIRFNKKGEFNTPTGKRDFNQKMSLKLQNFMAELKKRKIIFSSLDFKDFLVHQSFEEDDFVYLDPPYLISTASYNENGGWSVNNEKELLDTLDILTNKGVKFALSNVIIHKGKTNTLLKNWSKKYNVHYLDFNYNNSNYQSK
ncbi:Dam family site-specific DNA-(adenine-N6)-methyltransferase, partial [Streptococcus parasanguinis]